MNTLYVNLYIKALNVYYFVQFQFENPGSKEIWKPDPDLEKLGNQIQAKTLDPDLKPWYSWSCFKAS